MKAVTRIYEWCEGDYLLGRYLKMPVNYLQAYFILIVVV